jgi:putative endonuclease
MFYIYAIESQFDKRIYVGLTEDVEKRVDQHNKGKTKSTKPYRPWTVKYIETALTRLDARKREKYLKSGVGKEYLKSLRSRSSMDRIEVS